MAKWRMRRPSRPPANSPSALCTPTKPGRWDQDTDDVDLFIEGSSPSRSSSVPRVAIPPLDLSPAVARRIAKQAKRLSPRQDTADDDRRQTESLKEASAQLTSEGYFQEASGDVKMNGGEIVWPFWFSWLCAPQCADTCGQACEIEHVPHYERAHKIMAGFSQHEERPPEEELSYSHIGAESNVMAGGPLDYGSALEPEQPLSLAEIEWHSQELEDCLHLAVHEAQQLLLEESTPTRWEDETPKMPPPEQSGMADAAPVELRLERIHI